MKVLRILSLGKKGRRESELYAADFCGGQESRELNGRRLESVKCLSWTLDLPPIAFMSGGHSYVNSFWPMIHVFRG